MRRMDQFQQYKHRLLTDSKFSTLLVIWAILSTFYSLYINSCYQTLQQHTNTYKQTTSLRSAISSYISYNTSIDCPYIWHGGSPSQKHTGSCWCGVDTYCLCTPSLAIDAIIEVKNEIVDLPNIVLVKRKDPPKDVYAIPGGFVDVDETVEHAAIREALEETNIAIQPNQIEQFHVYSDPGRDKRRHTVSTVFRCLIDFHQTVHMHRGDDAKSLELVPVNKVLSLDLAFDHRQILIDYIRKYHPKVIQ